MRAAALVMGAALLGACTAARGVGGPPMPLAPEYVAGASIDTIFLSTNWLPSEPDFSDTFTDELREELALCAAGPRRLDMRVHLDDLRRGERAPGAEHHLSGLVELIDPATRAVVGRYPIAVSAGTPSPLAAVLADRQMVVSEAFGREVCRQVFGRNPRGHPLSRATGD